MFHEAVEPNNIATFVPNIKTLFIKTKKRRDVRAYIRVLNPAKVAT